MNWIVAVGEHGSHGLAGPMVAAAAVFPAGGPPPSYRYNENEDVVVGGLDRYQQMPGTVQEAVFADVKRRTASHATLRADGPSLRTEALKVRRNLSGLAVSRAMEHFFYLDPDKRDLSVANFTVQLPDQTPIPSKYFPHARQLGIAPGGFDWRCTAAKILARRRRDALILHLDDVYPEFDFVDHAGMKTKGHLRALELYGPCPEHHWAGAPSLAPEE